MDGEGGDPSPLRFRTYAAFPVLDAGPLLFGGGARAYLGNEILAAWAVFPAAIGLFVCSFVGVRGPVHDAKRLRAANARWRPSWTAYLAAAAAAATLLTAAALAAPVRGQSESVGVAPTFFVRFAPAVAPVNLVYLGRRYVGLRGA